MNDSNIGKGRLQQKLDINRQKNCRIEFLKILPHDLSAFLSGCKIITTPELDNIISKAYNMKSSKNATIREFSFEQQVLSYISILEVKQQEVFLFLGYGYSPLYIVDSVWAISNFHIIWSLINYSDIWIVGKDISCGITTSLYGGYLEHNPNPKEIFYEIRTWGLI